MDFNVNLDRNVRRKIFFGKVCLKSVNGSSCSECEKAGEFYRKANNAAGTDERSNLMEKARTLYARSKIFVNAIDTTDEDKSYPVRIYALPPSTYDDLMRQVKGLQILDNSVNVVHPFKGRNVLITKTGQGVQTRYSVQIDTRDTEIPNKQLLEQFKNGDLSGLHNLNNVKDFIEQNYMHIKQLENDTNIIRLLPPFDATKVIYSEVKFHRFTVDYVLKQEIETDESNQSAPKPAVSKSSPSSNTSGINDEYDPFSVSDEVSVNMPQLLEDDIPNFPSVPELPPTPPVPEPLPVPSVPELPPVPVATSPLEGIDTTGMPPETVAQIQAKLENLKN